MIIPIFLECTVLVLLTHPKTINPILFGRYCFGFGTTAKSDYSDPLWNALSWCCCHSQKLLPRPFSGMYCFGVVITAKSDYSDPLWNVLFWCCYHSQKRLPRPFLECIVSVLLTQPKAKGDFWNVVSGIANTAQGD